MAVELICALASAVLILRPFFLYFYDSKGLRKYPNQNFLSGFTTLAYVWERLHSFRTKRLYDQHLRYPIIRIAPDTLSFGDVRAINDIYGHGTPCEKHVMYQHTAGTHSHILNAVNRDDHARKRRMLSNAFATKNLEQWEFKIIDKVERLVKKLDSFATLPVSENQTDDLTLDFRWWTNLFTVDAIADIALSEKLHLIDTGSDLVSVNNVEKGRPLRFLESLHGGARVSSQMIGTWDWYPVLKAVTRHFPCYLSSQWACGGNFGAIVGHLARKRIQRHEQGEKLSDFLGCLIEDKLGKARHLDQGEIEAETNILLDAGSDTTAIALTHVIFYLIKNPSVLEKLRKEVDEAIAGNSIASYSKVKSLPYLKACLDESLRLSPPLPRGLERITPPSGMKIMGEWIPGNVGVSVPAYIAHRDPKLFPEPELYLPERWFDETKSKEMRAAFIPFSSGARACIGRNITMMEQQILIATLVHRYEFALISEDWQLEYEEAFNLWPKEMPLRIWRREVA